MLQVTVRSRTFSRYGGIKHKELIISTLFGYVLISLLYTCVVIWSKPASIQSFFIFLSLSVGALQIMKSIGVSINTSPNDSIKSKEAVFLLYIKLKSEFVILILLSVASI